MANKGKRKMSTEKMHGLTYSLVSQALWVLFLVVFVLALIYGAKKAYDFGYAVFSTKDRSGVLDVDVTISIKEGSSVSTVARQLEANNLIDSASVFWAQSILFECKIKPGVYTFSQKSSSRALLELFNKGPESATDESGQ